MYCPNCGTQNSDQAAFCVNCGTPLKNAAANNPSPPPSPPPAFNPPPNPGYQQFGQQRPTPVDKPETIINILAFCFPVVGLILYFVWKDTRPNSAKQICTASAIGFGVGVIIYLIMTVFAANVASSGGY